MSWFRSKYAMDMELCECTWIRLFDYYRYSVTATR